MRLTTYLSLSAVLAGVASALPQISRTGRYLYDSNGDRFYIKGVAYQEQGAIANDPNAPFIEPTSFTDPLADANACARDLPFLTQLGVNVIRVYSVNSTLNHDSCMQGLSGAGIYTIIDLSLPLNGSIDRNSPAWTTNLQDLYIETINAFSKYDNVLAYNVGNEIVTAANETATAPFIKAAARDIKAYLASQNLNTLVGYAAIDADRDWLVPLATYLAADTESDSLDIFGLNNYEWCGDSTFEDSYADVEGAFAGYNIPAYFSEFGCITSPPRLWTEVQALFSTQMSPVWSGGVAFSYFPAESSQGQFGMVTISSDGSTVTVSSDFTRLAAQYGQATGPSSPSMGNAGTTSYPAFPTDNSTFFASSSLPPTPNDTACACVVDTLSCQFTPQTSNTTVIVGELINTACGLLGQQGGTCNDIGGNGSTGTYGRLEYCDPASKLSFAMTLYYEATNRNAQSCSFAGNATVNKNAPGSASALNSAVSQCLVNTAPTFTPTLPANPVGIPGASNGGGGSGSGGSSPSSSKNAAPGVHALPFEGGVGATVMFAAAIAAGLWTITLA